MLFLTSLARNAGPHTFSCGRFSFSRHSSAGFVKMPLRPFLRSAH